MDGTGNAESQRPILASGRSGRSALSEFFAASRKDDGKVTLEWSNVSFSMLVKDATKSKPCSKVMKKKPILKSVSGKTESGELLAIMGPTGCGKTSLLNILACRVPSAAAATSSLTGRVMVNGEPRDEQNFRGISAYVLQDDNLYAHLTVVETLTLAATFFLPSTATEEFKSQLVEACIAELGLVKARDTRIGNEKVRGVSGGERKRVAIAQQLISDPAVLFLDEPTSGLDSFQALSVMESMKDLAMNGRLVISVIHQPRSSIFSMFDQLLLLSEGRTMYSGPAENAVAYFADVGFPCAAFYNPSDFFLDLLSPDNRSPELEEASQARIQRLGDVWLERGAGGLAQSKNGASTDNLANLVSEPQSAVRAVGTSGDCKKALTNLRVLCWRAFAAQSRDIGTFIFKCVLTTFFALIIGGIYSNIGFSQLSIQNRNGILYFICINIAFNNLIGVLNTFPTEKIIVNRERASRAYDTFSYFFAKVIIEIPLNTFPAVLYSCIVYWLVGLRPAGFGYFILIVMFEAIVAISLGLGISALAPSVEAANAFGPILMVIGILFGGFYLNVGSLPIVANWIPYFSIFYWTFQALAVNEYTGLTFTCDDAKGGSCLATGEMVIASLSFNSNAMNLAQINYACFGQGMLLIGFLGVAYILLSLSQTKFIPMGFQGSGYKTWLANAANEPAEAKPLMSTDKAAPHIAQGQVPPLAPPRQQVPSDVATLRDVEMQNLQPLGDTQRSPRLANTSPGPGANGQVAVSSF